MRIVDLSLPINSKMKAIPGIPAYDDNPTRCYPLSVISETQAKTLRAQGLEVPGTPPATTHMMSKLEITTHIGTHIDAPLHMLENTWSIDEVPLDHIVKKGRVIPLTDTPDGGQVTADAILATGVDFDDSVIPILHTGWTERAWGTPAFWDNTIYMHKSVGDLMVERGVSAVAIDFFPEVPFWRNDIEKPADHPRGYNHKVMLGNKCMIIQMLTNVGSIGSDDFILSAVPLKLEGIDGSPARVFAIVD